MASAFTQYHGSRFRITWNDSVVTKARSMNAPKQSKRGYCLLLERVKILLEGKGSQRIHRIQRRGVCLIMVTLYEEMLRIVGEANEEDKTTWKINV